MNPFRSEASAYRFLFLTIGSAAAVLIAATQGGAVWALAVLAVLAVAAFVWGWRHRVVAAGPTEGIAIRRGTHGERLILVVANETVGGERLLEEIRARSKGYREQVLVLCPALNSALRHWVSDEDGAREAARGRLDASLERLAAEGVNARGEIGDADPLQAIEDALRTFGADEIIISTHPPERSNWLERGVVEHARERFPVPITHVIGAAVLTPH